MRRQRVSDDEVELRDYAYDTDLTHEHFLHYVTAGSSSQSGLIAGFLRLSLPRTPKAGSRAFLDEIADSAMVREVRCVWPRHVDRQRA